jgi:hypothetical protein
MCIFSRKTQIRTTITKTQPQATLRLTLRRRKPIYPMWSFEWHGLEHKQDQLRELARNIQRKMREFDAECQQNGWQACGAIGCAIRSPEEAEQLFSPFVIPLSFFALN